MNSTEVDMAASRRVEIKFRLKEDEMIEKITEVLNQEPRPRKQVTDNCYIKK